MSDSLLQKKFDIAQEIQNLTLQLNAKIREATEMGLKVSISSSSSFYMTTDSMPHVQLHYVRDEINYANVPQGISP